MTRYVVSRILSIIPTMFIILLITFLLGYLGPINPVTIYARETFQNEGRMLTRDEIERLEASFGLDRPFLEQFGSYLSNIAQGEFGFSYTNATPVVSQIQRTLPVSGAIALGAFVLLIVLGIPLGLLAAYYKDSFLDNIIVSSTLLLRDFPVYVLIPMTLIVLVLWLSVMNVPNGWDGIWSASFLLAVILLSTRTLAMIIRQTRASVLEVSGREYVRTARAKGLTERQILTRHILREALIPVITTLGLLVDDFLWGAVFIDQAFNLPGLGRLFVRALDSRDFNLIYGITLFTAFLTILTNLIVDILYPFLDPRVTYD